MTDNNNIEVFWISSLYSPSVEYDLKVFGQHSDGTWDVEVYVNGTYCGTKTIERDTNIVEDCYNFVSLCVGMEDDIRLSVAEPICESAA